MIDASMQARAWTGGRVMTVVEGGRKKGREAMGGGKARSWRQQQQDASIMDTKLYKFEAINTMSTSNG